MKKCKVKVMLVRRFALHYLILCICVLIVIRSLYMYLIYQSIERNVIYFVNDDVISCHNIDDNNALPIISNTNFSPPLNSIFFHETSCKGGLDSRQACSVEAAARKHPYKEIYLLFNSPVSKHMLFTSCLAKLSQFKNVNILRVKLQEYAKETPLEAYIDKLLAENEWPVEHNADIAKILTLYKWGGIYLDLDMLVARPLTSLPNDWIARDSDISIGAGVMAVSKSNVGRKFIVAVIKDIITHMKRDPMVYNGKRIINKVLRKLCQRHDLSINWPADQNCTGFYIYSPSLFYPLHYSQRFWYFQPNNAIPKASGTDHIDFAYTHHLWNVLTEHYYVSEESFYAQLAKTHCPTIYHMYGHRFGF